MSLNHNSLQARLDQNDRSLYTFLAAVNLLFTQYKRIQQGDNEDIKRRKTEFPQEFNLRQTITTSVASITCCPVIANRRNGK